MRAALVPVLLLLSTPLAGCLGGDDYDTSGFEGCTGEETAEDCELDLPAEEPPANETTNETAAEPETETGTWENQSIPHIEVQARQLNGSWQNWSSHSLNGSWALIQFAATDCGHCVTAAATMSDLHAEHGGDVTFLTFVINFSWSNSSLEEIAAFQDQTEHSGCDRDQTNCADRPGAPHNWTYVDDRTVHWLQVFHMRGTPAYVIIGPDGVVVWHQEQREESSGDALDRLFGVG